VKNEQEFPFPFFPLFFSFPFSPSCQLKTKPSSGRAELYTVPDLDGDCRPLSSSFFFSFLPPPSFPRCRDELNLLDFEIDIMKGGGFVPLSFLSLAKRSEPSAVGVFARFDSLRQTFLLFLPPLLFFSSPSFLSLFPRYA